jgi:hypothetical protein
MQGNNSIQTELKELNSMLAGISNKNPYSVPDGYFDMLSHDIFLAIRQDEVPGINSLDVPDGYFDGLATAIMDKIKAGAEEDSAILSGLRGINVYRVPTGYFNGLAEKLAAGILAEEESAILTDVKGINVYNVPEQYFDNLAEEIKNKIAPQAKVIEMKKRSSFFNYAAAAVITGILGLSVLSVFDKKQSDISTSSENIAMTDASIDKEISSLSDADIVNYLQKSGLDVNAALVASLEDDKNLPDQVDYLTDDKTLDNLLNELKPGTSANN